MKKEKPPHQRATEHPRFSLCPVCFQCPGRSLLFFGMLLLASVSYCSVGYAQKWEKIIDDGDPGYSETGNAWSTWSHPSGYKGDYRYLSHQGKNVPRVGTATWQTVVPYTGQYEVYVYFRATVNRTTDADFRVIDGNGKRHNFVLNQQTMATGWHKLGAFAYTKGQTSRVILDGTDDNQSDEADAVKWVFANSNPPPPPPPPPTQGCESDKAGTYTMTRYAEAVQGKGDWKSPNAAQGDPDQKESSSPNVDAGDELVATGFRFCTPKGKYTITKVRVGVLGRMQYDNGQYKLILLYESLGKKFTFSQTQRLWVWGDITSAKSTWSLADVSNLSIRLALSSHPGGRRDSDAWVDAFAVEIQYQIAATSCEKGFTRCGDSCVNTAQSRYHCGACNKACGSKETCVSGACSQTCPSGTKLCDQACVDLSSDLQHCGACSASCREAELCTQSKCTLQCAAGETLCGNDCVALKVDPKNCGGCGKACSSGQTCKDGACAKETTCPDGQTLCNGGCVATQSDPNHCGSCDVTCGQNVVCRAGVCAPPDETGSEEEKPANNGELPSSLDAGTQDKDGAIRDVLPVTRTSSGCLCQGHPSSPFWLSGLFMFVLVWLSLRRLRSTR
ncbi:MAG: hypothetical protein EP343_33290 [Deltaproteobacteria bacterium]|nr:MAG: hypothetical protein EP343_33290 [Deltaproteobacteria bacterium]